ncbi:Porin B [Klebsiella pneumoniae]|nr:Porin B [Klebsiella pneumoniae]
MAYNAGGGYNHDKHLAYIDQVALTFTQDLERWTGIPDARLEGNIVNRNHDDNLTTKRLQDPRVSFNDLSQESWGGGSITRLGWLTFARSFDDRRLTAHRHDEQGANLRPDHPLRFSAADPVRWEIGQL